MFGLMFEVEEEGDQTGAFAFIESSLSFHCLENLYYFKVLGSIPLIVNLDSLSVHDTVNVTLSNKFKVPITCVTENKWDTSTKQDANLIPNFTAPWNPSLGSHQK
jgi:hypothetical protein